MGNSWDNISALIDNEELGTIAIELVVILSAIAIVVVLFYLKRKYPTMTKKGFDMMILGFGIFTLHTIADCLDTLAVKKVDGETTSLYLFLDFLDAIFSFLGLILVGIAFLRIADYGMQVWKEERP
ncbi:MAG: hypothetical protein ACTSWW_06205 [Promethearchaeota archaeon]